jgi:hypothetical protein
MLYIGPLACFSNFLMCYVVFQKLLPYISFYQAFALFLTLWLFVLLFSSLFFSIF